MKPQTFLICVFLSVEKCNSNFMKTITDKMLTTLMNTYKKLTHHTEIFPCIWLHSLLDYAIDFCRCFHHKFIAKILKGDRLFYFVIQLIIIEVSCPVTVDWSQAKMGPQSSTCQQLTTLLGVVDEHRPLQQHHIIFFGN